MHARRIMIAISLCVLSSGLVFAQEDDAAEGGMTPNPTVIEIKQQDIAPLEHAPGNYRSLFYTQEEYTLLKEAIRLRVPPSRRVKTTKEEKIVFVEPPKVEAPPPRMLMLSGIIYTSPKDWTLWLNGQRVVPGALPSHAKALSVTKEYIDLKWHDVTSNQIFTVRLRPHQNFDIETRTFISGAIFSGSTAEAAPDMTVDNLDDGVFRP